MTKYLTLQVLLYTYLKNVFCFTNTFFFYETRSPNNPKTTIRSIIVQNQTSTQMYTPLEIKFDLQYGPYAHFEY